MIKANELRKGVLVIDYTGHVREVFGEDIQQQCWYEEGQGGTTEAPLNPIPITPEWLERCGFVRGSSYIGIGYHWDGPNEISIVQQQVDKEDTYRLYGSEWTIGKDFKYLHQLQNLYFALTGEELQIKEP